MAESMVNVIQNISQNRTDKRIMLRDLNYARASAGLVYYGGTAHYAVNKSDWRPLGSCLEFYIYLVKGMGHNRCKVKWALAGGLFHDTPDNIKSISEFDFQSDHSEVHYSSDEMESSLIYKSLQIEKDQIKIILDLCIWMEPSLKMADGTLVGAIPISKRFGLYLSSSIKRTGSSYFHSVVIFTPKPGLFSETPPR